MCPGSANDLNFKLLIIINWDDNKYLALFFDICLQLISKSLLLRKWSVSFCLGNAKDICLVWTLIKVSLILMGDIIMRRLSFWLANFFGVKKRGIKKLKIINIVHHYCI